MADNFAQLRFNARYITATEIAEDLGVSRVSVLRAKQRGLLLDPIQVGDNHVCIWERDAVKSSIEAWRRVLSCRGGKGT